MDRRLDEPGTHPYLSLTDADRREMLAAVGVETVEELFRDIPDGVRFVGQLELEPALSELELVRELGALAARNVAVGDELSFLGAGIYDHHVPAVVDAVLGRGELLTAYTPYQPEMSQGVLQAIFEYQTAICELTGMEVSNASGYDGTTVAADACYMAKHLTGRTKIVVAETLSPQVRAVVSTYAVGFGMQVETVPQRGGTIDPAELGAAAEGAAIVLFQQPSFLGCLEPAPELAAAAEAAGALACAHVDPLSLGVLEAPGAYGASIAIGEGQAAGNWPSYGGPHYGFLAAKREFTRRMPGRIIGETTDANGDRGFVLTLQTREQHIRREKATSNITTNQTLLALGGLITLAWLGPHGLREVGEACTALGAYAKERLTAAGFELVFPERATFKECAVRVGRNAREVVTEARRKGVHPGYALGQDYEGMDDVLLVATTERRTTAEIDRLVDVLTEVAA
jgi:glycine dehydrogenase subunit 1